MNRFSSMLTLSLLALALAATGCESSEAPETEGETVPASGEDSSFAFAGDFSGPLGVQLYSFRDAMPQDVPGTLARVRALGFEEVELAGTYGMTPQQFKQELDRAGLRATAMHAPYERMRDSLQAVLEEARALGVEYVGVAWIPHQEGQPFTEQMARQTAADFNQWGRAAREQGVTFFYHTHGYEFQPTPNGTIPFDVLVAETDSQNVKFEMDVFWVSHPGVDPVALLRKYPDRWKLMHVKDMKPGTPSDFSGHAPPDESQVPVGTGQINYAEVLRAAREVGVERYYIEDETSDPFSTIPQSTRYLESVRYGS